MIRLLASQATKFREDPLRDELKDLVEFAELQTQVEHDVRRPRVMQPAMPEMICLGSP